MILVLLVYSWDVQSMKNICHAYSAEKYNYVIYVHLFSISCKIAKAKNMNKTCMWNFLYSFVDYEDHGKNAKSVVWYFYSTKYFLAHLYTLAYHFCVDCFTYLNAIKILW
jgi:hypothetical protein